MKIWFDTEFIEDGKTIDLLSIGLVREDGETYYAELSETNRLNASHWVVKNVIPFLKGPIKPRWLIAKEVQEFVGDDPEFWAYYADYDWVVLCQLYGTMMDLPVGWPMFCRDLQQFRSEAGIAELPPMGGQEHNALDDALWTKVAHEFCIAAKEAKDAKT
jgi:hypothetical protein